MSGVCARTCCGLGSCCVFGVCVVYVCVHVCLGYVLYMCYVCVFVVRVVFVCKEDHASKTPQVRILIRECICMSDPSSPVLPSLRYAVLRFDQYYKMKPEAMALQFPE